MALKTEQLKAYAEPELKKVVGDYAYRNSMTESQAVRALVMDGLRLAQYRDQASSSAEVEYLSELNKAS